MRLLSAFWICLLAHFIDGNIDVDLVNKCCMLGSQWSDNSGGRCPPYPSADLQGVDTENAETCVSLVSLCCGLSSRHQQCNVGRDLARADNSCSSLKVNGAKTAAYVQRKECCQCCQLGMLAASSKESCDMFETSGKICDRSPDCCESFYTCCNSSNTDTASGTTASPTTTESPEDNFREPVHIPGGICARFSSALCEHYCHDAPDRPNKFRCTCRRGFELAANRRNCVETKSPATCETNNPCDDTAECYARGATLLCRCTRNGYRLVGGTTCEDINECVQGLDTCTDIERCENTKGGFNCVRIRCPHNTKYDPLSQKCVTRSRSCPPNEVYDRYSDRCVSARPSNQRCPQGYAYNVLTYQCEDVDECISNLLHNCSDSLTCRNIPGHYLCECSPGLAFNYSRGVCEDVDECAIGQDNCDAGQRCENTPGSFACRRHVSCGTGYTLQEDSQACVDVNECQLSTHNCGPAFTCRNIPGSFRCEYKTCPPGTRLNLGTGECMGAITCRQGFAYDEFSRQCQDVNECLTENPCFSSEKCVNTEGSYKCVSQTRRQCFNGFELNPASTSCIDVDECERGTHNCENKEACQNTQGSFRCQCSPGFALDSVTNTCSDIDECSRSVGQYCNPMNSICVNTPGSFRCQCKEGFESIAGGKACQDVNECLTPNFCAHNCYNVWGSYQCRCRPGFRLAADKRSCNDINECELASTRGRLCNGFCENVPGSFKCTCPPGFRLSDSGRECLDIDECAERLAGCNGPNQVCINTRGSYKCNIVECPRYFSLAADSLSRSSVRCARQTFVCPQGDAECLTAPLSLSYNFLAIRASRIRVPTELFTMRGPESFPRIEFNIDVNSVRNLGRDSIRVTKDHFKLRVDPAKPNVAVVSIVLPIQGQQDVELKLNMNIYNSDGFFGTATATITLYATVDPWEESVAVDEGVFCYKKCPIDQFDTGCYLNVTNVVSYHFLSLPTVSELEEPIKLFTLDSSSDAVYPNVVFEILSGNNNDTFRLTREGLYRGSLELQTIVIGPTEFNLRLKMEASNLNRVIATSQIAVVKIYVSPYLYEIIS